MRQLITEIRGFPDTKRKDNDSTRAMYQAIGSHPAIISKEAFDEVQAERERRSNVIAGSDGAIRKTTRYSSLKGMKTLNQEGSAEQPSKEETAEVTD